VEVWECGWKGGLSPRNQNLQIEQNMLAEFVYIPLGGEDMGDRRKFCDLGSLRVGTGTGQHPESSGSTTPRDTR